MKADLLKIFLAGFLAAGLSLSNVPVWADDTNQLKEQVQALQNRVDQLESELSQKQQPAVSANPYANQWDDPFAQMMMMERQMDRAMGQSFNAGMYAPRMDMQRKPKAYIITMDIPGMDKNKINIQSKDGMLTISGERQSESSQDNQGGQYYRQERSFGSFMQAIPLPDDATDKIDAHYNNGVLTVTVGRRARDHQGSDTAKIPVS